MSNSEKIISQADSLIDLLAAQCTDLENLLSLARQETVAVKKNDFEELLRIVSERDKISQRLESFQQQIGTFHDFLEAAQGNPRKQEIAEKIIKISNLTLTQDKQNKLLLEATRENAAGQLRQLEKSLRGTNAYLRDRQKGLAYNQSF